MTQVVFNYNLWAARYPEFNGTVDLQKAGMLFTEAGIYLDNSDSSIVQDIPTRTLLYNMIVAHLAQLYYGSSLRPATGQVGRIASAGEGSVNVTFDYDNGAGDQKFWSQTIYGTSYWNATGRYRSFTYVPGRQPRFTV